MTTFNFFESNFRFTSPIRYFKSNDPIYFEVENIPLKQLHENDLWLKDQIFNLRLNAEGGVERQNINELRPYVNGVDNVIRVKPGRFTARINDAYDIDPLQVITRFTGTNSNGYDYNTWLARSSSSSDISNIISRFKEAVALNLNGLVERAFTYPAFRSDIAATDYYQSTPRFLIIGGVDEGYGQPPFPGIGAVLFNNFNTAAQNGVPGNQYVIRQYDNTDGTDGVATNIGFARLGSAETAFIKRWRGVARTAVVDIPEELTIEIPPFDSEDFYYYNEQGVKQYIEEASQRVDLVFIYSKPVDASSTTIAKYVNGVPSKITTPQLGIVYGAGLGVNFRSLSTRIQEVLGPNNVPKIIPSTDDTTLPDGTMKMLAHFGDQTGQNIGFSGSNIKGSFPAPDDLMNLSPLLDEELDSDSLALIGQSVLPIAYVVVKRSPTLNTDGIQVIASTDLVDIRPFFRTTELAYNERAGIAAAVPSISLANPVVSQAELDYELKKLRLDIEQIIPEIPDIPRPVYKTFYTSSYEDVWVSNPDKPDRPYLLISQTVDNLGTADNPLQTILPTFPRFNPIQFPIASDGLIMYSQYVDGIYVMAEMHHKYNDSPVTKLYASVIRGDSRVNQYGTFFSIAAAGNFVKAGDIENRGGDTQSAAGSVNMIFLPLSGTMTNPTQLPIVLNTFTSEDTWSANSANYFDYHDALVGDRMKATIYILGYRLRTHTRFKAIEY